MYPKHNILIIDSETIVRRGLRRILERDRHMVPEESLPEQALQSLLLKTFDVALVKVGADDNTSVDLMESISRIFPATKLVVLSGHSDVEAVQRYARAGMAAYLKTDISEQVLLQKIKQVIEREPSFINAVSGAILEYGLATPNNYHMRELTPKQVEVGRLWCRGLVKAEIARQLGITVNTVKTHLRLVYLRTLTDSREKLQICFRKHKLIDP